MFFFHGFGTNMSPKTDNVHLGALSLFGTFSRPLPNVHFLMHFASPLVHLRLPFASLRLPFGVLWLSFASLLVPFCSPSGSSFSLLKSPQVRFTIFLYFRWKSYAKSYFVWKSIENQVVCQPNCIIPKNAARNSKINVFCLLFGARFRKTPAV